jgi:hypothetical protein
MSSSAKMIPMAIFSIPSTAPGPRSSPNRTGTCPLSGSPGVDQRVAAEASRILKSVVPSARNPAENRLL